MRMTEREDDVQPGTIPSAAQLWKLANLARQFEADQIAVTGWRITNSDWDEIRRYFPLGTVEPANQPGEPDRLFGFSVELVPNARHRWPELMFKCDQRMRLPGDQP
jgi:hypothetical protein